MHFVLARSQTGPFPHRFCFHLPARTAEWQKVANVIEEKDEAARTAARKTQHLLSAEAAKAKEAAAAEAEKRISDLRAELSSAHKASLARVASAASEREAELRSRVDELREQLLASQSQAARAKEEATSLTEEVTHERRRREAAECVQAVVRAVAERRQPPGRGGMHLRVAVELLVCSCL